MFWKLCNYCSVFHLKHLHRPHYVATLHTVRRRSRRTFSTQFEIFRRRVGFFSHYFLCWFYFLLKVCVNFTTLWNLKIIRKKCPFRLGLRHPAGGGPSHPRRLATHTNMGKDRAFGSGDMLADKQTDRHTDALITILRHRFRGWCNKYLQFSPENVKWKRKWRQTVPRRRSVLSV